MGQAIEGPSLKVHYLLLRINFLIDIIFLWEIVLTISIIYDFKELDAANIVESLTDLITL